MKSFGFSLKCCIREQVGACVQKIELRLHCENTHKTTVVTADTATIELLSVHKKLQQCSAECPVQVTTMLRGMSSASDGRDRSCLQRRLYVELSISPKPNSIWGFASIMCFSVKNAMQWLAGFVGCTFSALFYHFKMLDLHCHTTM